MSAWQPIETAPKDGTWVMLVVKGFLPSIGHWMEYEGRSRWFGDPEDHLHQRCFSEMFHQTDYAPTHWQPLPEPPEDAP